MTKAELREMIVEVNEQNRKLLAMLERSESIISHQQKTNERCQSIIINQQKVNDKMLLQIQEMENNLNDHINVDDSNYSFLQ